MTRFDSVLVATVLVGFAWGMGVAHADPVEDKIRAELRLKKIRYELETVTVLNNRVEFLIADSLRRTGDYPLASSLCYEAGPLQQSMPEAMGTIAGDDRFAGDAQIRETFKTIPPKLVVFQSYCDDEGQYDASDFRAANQAIANAKAIVSARIDADLKPQPSSTRLK